MILDMDYFNFHKSFAVLTSSDNVYSIKWHARLDHIGQDMMTRLVREGLICNLVKVFLPV